MFDFLTGNFSEILQAVTAVIAAASAIANLTPTDADNKAIGIISRVVNLLALNFRR